MTEITFWRFINFLCATTPASLIAGHRSRHYNRLCRHSNKSPHLGFKAADVVLDTPAKAARIMRAAESLGLTVRDCQKQRGWVHIHDPTPPAEPPRLKKHSRYHKEKSP